MTCLNLCEDKGDKKCLNQGQQSSKYRSLGGWGIRACQAVRGLSSPPPPGESLRAPGLMCSGGTRMGHAEQTASRVTAAGGPWARAPKKGRPGEQKGRWKGPGDGPAGRRGPGLQPSGQLRWHLPRRQNRVTRDEVPERKVTGAVGWPWVAATTSLPPARS